MNFETILTTIQNYQQAQIPTFETLNSLLNDTFGDWLASQGISHLALLPEDRLCFNVTGQLQNAAQTEGIEFYQRFLIVAVREIAGADAIAEALTHYDFDGDGAYVWLIPDGYMAALTLTEQVWERDGGGYFSHESICISNTSDRGTRCLLEVLYEGPSMENVSCEFDVPAHRSVHYRLDKLKDENGAPLIAKDAPVSYKITSRDARIVVQGSRILTSGEKSAFASFGTVMAWSPQ